MTLSNISASLHPDFLSPELESFLLPKAREALATAPYHPSDRSRIARFGWDYHGHQQVQEEPRWLKGLYLMLRPFTTTPAPPDSTTLNEYLPGRGIAPHIDPLEFDEPILILSLGASCEFRLSKSEKNYDCASLAFTFPERALLSLRGPSRWEWEHEVRGVQELRYSLVFRWLLAPATPQPPAATPP